MTDTEEDRAHEDLRRLFEATAGVASGPTLTKLAARAADVPERAGHGSRFLPRWAWVPAFASAIVALGGLLALLTAAPKAPHSSGAERGSASATDSVARIAPSTGSARANTTQATPGALDELSDSTEFVGDADEGARFDVAGPQSDRDLDAWLAAAKDLSGGT